MTGELFTRSFRASVFGKTCGGEQGCFLLSCSCPRAGVQPGPPACTRAGWGTVSVGGRVWFWALEMSSSKQLLEEGAWGMWSLPRGPVSGLGVRRFGQVPSLFCPGPFPGLFFLPSHNQNPTV